MERTNEIRQQVHTEDIQDIISTPPSWLLRWGITLVLLVLLSITLMATFIRYPDVMQTSLRINAINAPKAVVSRISGNIVKLLVEENESVKAGQELAWMESTASHRQVLELLQQMQALRENQLTGAIEGLSAIDTPTYLQLGELQNAYQAFYQSYPSFKATTDNGIYLKQRRYIQQDVINIQAQRQQLLRQQFLQEQEYALAEFQQQQAAFLAKQHPLQQAQSSLLANKSTRAAKTKELADLDNQIAEEKSKFMQALNSLISDVEQWKSQYILTAWQSGEVVQAGIIQENRHINAGQEIFYINPGSTDFFGEINIPQYNMGKVKKGQEVLIKLSSYPFEEYGILKGQVSQINKVPQQDSVFMARVELAPIVTGKNIQLNTGLMGSAEIITEDASLFSRLCRNIIKITNSRN